MQNTRIQFPELWRIGTFEAVPVLLGSGFLGGICFGCRWWLGILVGSPAILILGNVAVSRIVNAGKRLVWAWSFDQRISVRTLQRLLRTDPEHFVLHVAFYGGFDTMPECPAAVLRDEKTGRLMALWPASWQVRKIAQQPEIKVHAPQINRVA